MPKPATYPTLFNEALQLNISKLKDWGYLEYNKRGVIDWSSDGRPTGRISIRSRITDEEKNVELDYNYGDEPRKYKIFLTCVMSNLGKGEIWYFVCPQTGKRCRKLYSIGGYFLHRSAFRGCMYDSQTKSKKWREMERVYGVYFELDRLYEQLYSKHFKRHYNGKPTRRYLTLLKKIEDAEAVSISNLKRHF